MTVTRRGASGRKSLAQVEPLVRRLERQAPGDRDPPHFWALRAAQTFGPAGGGWDRGFLSIYLLNLVHLRPGEATYQPAGVLHAYLEETNVELMANSDNVLRGGLTAKHIDVPELLRIVRFEGSTPTVLRGTERGPGERAYPTSAADFELSRITLPPGKGWERSADESPEIWLVLDGTVTTRPTGGPGHTFHSIEQMKAVSWRRQLPHIRQPNNGPFTRRSTD